MLKTIIDSTIEPDTSKTMGLSPSVQNEVNGLLFGEHLGSGVYRSVYACLINPKLVIKVEDKACSFSNIAEWEVWQEIVGTQWERWFAPIWGISASGSVLLQERTQPLKRIPKELPEFMADLKRANFGMLNGRVVAHDYANHKLFVRGLRHAKVKPADFWSDT